MASNTAVQLAATGSVDWNQVFKTGAVSALTAGLTNYGFFEGGQSLNSLAGLSAAPAGASGVANATGGLSFSWDQFYGVMGRGVVSAGVSSAIQGTDFRDAFIGSVVGDYAALSANTIGSVWGNGQNPVLHTLAHTALGAGAAHLTGGDAAAGAIGGLVEASLDNTLGQHLRESGVELDTWGRLGYLAGATLAGGLAAEAAGHDGAAGARAAQNAAANNYLTALQLAQVEEARRDCAGDALCEARVTGSAQNLSRQQDFELTVAKAMCVAGWCERLDVMTAMIERGNDPVLVQQYLEARSAYLTPDAIQGAVDYYRAGAQASLDSSTWNVVDSTLYFAGAAGALTAPPTVPFAETAKGVLGIPGRVASRINVSNEGMEHVIARHLSGKANASQFSLSEVELRSLLSSRDAVKSPVVRSVESADGIRYVREFDAGRVIGVDRFGGNQPTSVVTIMTDRFGNLVSAFPGLLK